MRICLHMSTRVVIKIFAVPMGPCFLFIEWLISLSRVGDCYAICAAVILYIICACH